MIGRDQQSVKTSDVAIQPRAIGVGFRRCQTRLETGDEPSDPEYDDSARDGDLDDPRSRRIRQRVRDVVVWVAGAAGGSADEAGDGRARESERLRGRHGMVVVELVNDVRVNDKPIEINVWGTRSFASRKQEAAVTL